MSNDFSFKTFAQFVMVFVWLNNLLVANLAFYVSHLFGLGFTIFVVFMSVAMIAYHLTEAVRLIKEP